MQDNLRFFLRKQKRNLYKTFGSVTSELTTYLSYPFRPRKSPLTKFFIFGFQRTGSTLLVDLLDSHPHIHCEGELLLGKVFSPITFLECRSRLCEKDVFGFKLLTPHFQYQGIQKPDMFLADLCQAGYKTIKLKRRNILRAALSLYYAIVSGIFHFNDNYEEAPLPKIIIEPKELLDKIQWIEFHSTLQDRLSENLPHLEIIYEDDLQNNLFHQNTVDRIADYLGVPHAPVHTNWAKSPIDSISNIAANADEITEFIRQTEYAEFLDM